MELYSFPATLHLISSRFRADIERVKADFMLLGAATVIAAAMRVLPSEFSQEVGIQHVHMHFVHVLFGFVIALSSILYHIEGYKKY